MITNGWLMQEEMVDKLTKSGIATVAISIDGTRDIHNMIRKEGALRMGVKTWQVQLGLPMGNLKERPNWLLKSERVYDIIDVCNKTAKEGRIKIYTADCIGYYTNREMEIKRMFMDIPLQYAYIEVLKQLKKRTKIVNEEFVKVPYELKFLAYFPYLRGRQFELIAMILKQGLGTMTMY
jgi:hypothetical protein